MPTRKTRAEMKAATRERVLAAAERIAVDQGLGRITMEAVAERAGMTKGAIYSNFASKDELLFAVVERLTTGLTATEAVFEATGIDDLLARLADEVVDVTNKKSKQAVLALEFDMLAIRDRKLRQALGRQRAKDLAATRASGPNEFDAWVAARGEELPVPADQFVEIANALAWGIIVRRLVYGPETLPDDLIAWVFSRLGSGGSSA